MKIIAVAIALSFFCAHAKSTSFIDRPVEEVYGDSLIVAKGILTKINGECKNSNLCSSYRMEIEPEEILMSTKIKRRERKNKSTIVFCSKFPLWIGSEYYIFLHGKEDNDSCDLVLPIDGVFQKKANTYFRVNSPESVHWINYEGRAYESSTVIEPDFEDFIKQLSRQPD